MEVLSVSLFLFTQIPQVPPALHHPQLEQFEQARQGLAPTHFAISFLSDSEEFLNVELLRFTRKTNPKRISVFIFLNFHHGKNKLLIILLINF
jgi:hypothetical protein